jgi:hypothetical protein
MAGEPRVLNTQNRGLMSVKIVLGVQSSKTAAQRLLMIL